MKRKVPHSPGVYQIKCTANGKIYIGSAMNLYSRFVHHRRCLRYGNHVNAHLQAAWNKYGEECFDFEVLELVTPDKLIQIEQHWLDKTQPYNRDIGFNIYQIAGSPGNILAQTWEGFVDPNGNEITIHNLFDFCRQNHLDFPSMHRLARGKSKLKSHKGWTHKNSIRKRDHVKTYEGFIDPNGATVGPVTNLADFCKKNGLDNTHMVAVAKGRLYSHHGWTYQNNRRNEGYKIYKGFVDPHGHKVIIENLELFCRENNLSAVHMRELIKGKRKSHKGWIWDEK